MHGREKVLQIQNMVGRRDSEEHVERGRLDIVAISLQKVRLTNVRTCGIS